MPTKISSINALKTTAERLRADTASQILELTNILTDTVADLETLQTQVSELVDALTTEEIDTAFADDSTDGE